MKYVLIIDYLEKKYGRARIKTSYSTNGLIRYNPLHPESNQIYYAEYRRLYEHSVVLARNLRQTQRK